MKEYIIWTTQGQFDFIGKHLPEKEKQNWHYYERNDGAIVHFRKEHMVAIVESELEEDDG